MTEEETKALVERILREGLAVLLMDKKVSVETYQVAKGFVEETIEELYASAD